MKVSHDQKDQRRRRMLDEMPCPHCSEPMEFWNDTQTTLRGLMPYLAWFENYKCPRCAFEYHHDITPREPFKFEEEQ